MRWEDLISLVILANFRRFDQNLSIVSPSLNPIPTHRRGPYTTYYNKLVLQINISRVITHLTRDFVSIAMKSRETQINTIKNIGSFLQLLNFY